LWFSPQDAITPHHLFTNDAPAEGTSEKDKGTEGTQTKWTRVLARIPNSSLKLVDRHSQDSLGTRRPDDVVYFQNFPRNSV